MASYLDRQLKDVCSSEAHVAPFKRFAKASGQIFPGGEAALKRPVYVVPPPLVAAGEARPGMGGGQPPPPGMGSRPPSPPPPGGAAPGGQPPQIDRSCPPVTNDVIEKLMSALASLGNADDDAVSHATGITIGAFRRKAAADQILWINEFWDKIAKPYRFDTLAQRMYVPNNPAPTGNEPLPSGWCPMPRQPNLYHMRRSRAGQRDPWLEYTVGFRVDGSNDAAIDRVKTDGMTQQSLNVNFMRNFRGLVVEGTEAANPNKPRFWSGNSDIVNETAVCVSRNFFGGTAFPERTMKHTAPNEFAILWAVDCRGLIGMDTEAIQRSLPRPRHWRPGEKAFQRIPANRVIGYVKIRKLGAPPTGGWSFEILPNASWTYSGGGMPDQKVYIVEELAAWRGKHDIKPEFDFAA